MPQVMPPPPNQRYKVVSSMLLRDTCRVMVATIILVHNSQQLQVSVTDRLTMVFTVRAGIFTKRITKSIRVIFSIAVTPKALVHQCTGLSGTQSQAKNFVAGRRKTVRSTVLLW